MAGLLAAVAAAAAATAAALDNGRLLTPPMGLNTWTSVGTGVTSDFIWEMADFFVSSGMREGACRIRSGTRRCGTSMRCHPSLLCTCQPPPAHAAGYIYINSDDGGCGVRHLSPATLNRHPSNAATPRIHARYHVQAGTPAPAMRQVRSKRTPLSFLAASPT